MIDPAQIDAAAEARVSPFAILEAHASRSPHSEAVWAHDIRLRYPELLDRIAACADTLLRQGLQPGVVTGIEVRHEIGHLLVAMALLCLGTPQVCLASHELASNKRAIAQRLGVVQIIAEWPDDWMEGFRVIAAPEPQMLATAGAARFTRHGAAQLPHDWIALYRNTSGTTNVPKSFGVTLDHLLTQAERNSRRPNERRILRTSSMEYEATRSHRIWSLLGGECCVFAHGAELRDLAALCARAQVSSIHIGTYKLASVLRASGSARLPAFTYILTGGSRVPGALRANVKSMLTDNLWVSYATAELGMISLASPEQHEAYPEGVGLPLDGVKIELVDAHGEPVRPGEMGEARVQKRTQPRTYVADAAASANFKDGWFYPRDLLSRPEGGPLIFHMRVDDTMVLDGINIYPTPIEDLLEAHPDVVEAAAFPIVSHLHGEIPAAAIVLEETATECDPARFLAYCRSVLGLRGPRHIVVVPSIPRNHVGKPLRRQLAREFAAGM